MHALTAITAAGTAISALGYLTFGAMAWGTTDSIRSTRSTIEGEALA
ncbi:hypothetical protein [Nocardia jejuensis]|nr:hypothetical protein [Nocardia jejuensis]